MVQDSKSATLKTYSLVNIMFVNITYFLLSVMYNRALGYIMLK